LCLLYDNQVEKPEIDFGIIVFRKINLDLSVFSEQGVIIKEQPDDRGVSLKKFTSCMNMFEKSISRLINSEALLNPDVANRLETVLGLPAAFWNNLEALYWAKLTKAEAKTDKLIPYY